MSKKLTPMMQQFYDLKAKHPDALLLFRCGDFYETYGQDAVTASTALGITLTKRSNKDAQSTEMAGFPYHALDNYLPRLVRAGFRVAICDQLEDPKLTKKLVKRGITELVTPGVVMGDNVLNAKENNFVAAFHFGRNLFGLSLLDISTGEFLVTEGDLAQMEKLLSGFSPKEVLLLRGTRARFEEAFRQKLYLYELDDWAFSEKGARERLRKALNVHTLKGFGIDHLSEGLTAAAAILSYLEMTQHTQTAHITSLRRIEEERYVRIDAFTARNLELVTPLHPQGQTLLQTIDRTLTPMGARQLHRWMLFPLRQVADIEWRATAVEHFFRDPELSEFCHDLLAPMGDLERIASKIATARVSPRELATLSIGLQSIGLLKNALTHATQPSLNDLGQKFHPLEQLQAELDRTLAPDPPAMVNKGGVIAEGISEELDELRRISRHGKAYLQEIQQRESERTGIPSLKVAYNNVFGYYIEVRNTYKDRVPAEWVRKQTLVGAERYITQELKEYEEKILGAEDRILALESQLFSQLVQTTAQHISDLQENATLLAILDALHSLATIAKERRYVRPVVDESLILDIRQGRHPVIETLLPPGEDYIPNDVLLNSDAQQIIIITGPNMAGKSALLRQTALIVLLAQMGGFVPATSARIGVIDKVFTRVGASDNLSQGESTFMVEMSEAANIMNNLTPRSLVLFDELGRGTSTYDGISIAWSIVERLHEDPDSRARTLFATHYHELNEMEKAFPRVKNYNVSVREVKGKVVFLRTLQRGGSEHSFGIHVARLAGMPQPILKRAEAVLQHLEAGRTSVAATNAADTLSTEPAHTASPAVASPAVASLTPSANDGLQLSFFQLDDPVLTQIRDEIFALQIDTLTPIEALNKLHDIQRIVRGH